MSRWSPDHIVTLTLVKRHMHGWNGRFETKKISTLFFFGEECGRLLCEKKGACLPPRLYRWNDDFLVPSALPHVLSRRFVPRSSGLHQDVAEQFGLQLASALWARDSQCNTIPSGPSPLQAKLEVQQAHLMLATVLETTPARPNEVYGPSSCQPSYGLQHRVTCLLLNSKSTTR